MNNSPRIWERPSRDSSWDWVSLSKDPILYARKTSEGWECQGRTSEQGNAFGKTRKEAAENFDKKWKNNVPLK